MANTLNINFINSMDRGLAYAESCFETFRVIDGEVFQWPEHWSRLTLGLASFGLRLEPKDADVLRSACIKHANETANDCLIRLTASGGSAEWGLLKQGEVTFYIQASTFQKNSHNLDLLSVENPFPIYNKIAKYTADYSQTLRAIQLWQQQHAQAKPNQYLIQKDGMLISGITSNILLLHQNQWLTPEGDGILPGIISRSLINEGAVQAQPCPVDLLLDCEAMLMLNSGQFVQVVHSVDGQKLNTEHPHISKLKNILNSNQGVRIE